MTELRATPSRFWESALRLMSLIGEIFSNRCCRFPAVSVGHIGYEDRLDVQIVIYCVCAMNISKRPFWLRSETEVTNKLKSTRTASSWTAGSYCGLLFGIKRKSIILQQRLTIQNGTLLGVHLQQFVLEQWWPWFDHERREIIWYLEI